MSLVLAAGLTLLLAALALLTALTLALAVATTTTGLLGAGGHGGVRGESAGSGYDRIGHLSTLNADYLGTLAVALHTGHVLCSDSHVVMAARSNTWKQSVTAAVAVVMGSRVIGQVSALATASATMRAVT